MPVRYRPSVPVEPLQPFVEEANRDLGYYFSQIWAGWQIKGPIGAVVGVASTFYTQVFFGNWVLFCLWILFITVDVILGVLVACKKSEFTIRRLKEFITKVFGHLITIALFGFLNHSFSVSSGTALPFTDWFMTMLLCTEALSILVNMDKLGLPVPKVAHKIIAKMNKSASQKIDEVLGVKDED